MLSFDVPGTNQERFSVIVSSAVCADRRAFTVRLYPISRLVRGILEPIALRLRFKIYDQGPRTIFSDIITGSRAREGGRFSRSNISRASITRTQPLITNAPQGVTRTRYMTKSRTNLKLHGSDRRLENKQNYGAITHARFHNAQYYGAVRFKNAKLHCEIISRVSSARTREIVTVRSGDFEPDLDDSEKSGRSSLYRDDGGGIG